MYKKGNYLKLVFVPMNVFVLPHIRFHRLMMAISVKTKVWSPKLYMYKVESLKIHQVSKVKIWSLICAHSDFQWNSKCLTEVTSCTANPPCILQVKPRWKLLLQTNDNNLQEEIMGLLWNPHIFYTRPVHSKCTIWQTITGNLIRNRPLRYAILFN